MNKNNYQLIRMYLLFTAFVLSFIVIMGFLGERPGSVTDAAVFRSK